MSKWYCDINISILILISIRVSWSETKLVNNCVNWNVMEDDVAPFSKIHEPNWQILYL